MCLGIPARIVKTDGSEASVDVGGVRRVASLALIEGVTVGDYVIVHAGFAIEKIDEAAAEETLRAIAELAGGGKKGGGR